MAQHLYYRSGQGDADSYYKNRATIGEILGCRERRALHYTVQTYTSDRVVVELGAGAAQYSHVLSHMGFRTIALDIDRQRTALARALRDLVGGMCELHRADFLDFSIPEGALIVCLNLVSAEVSSKHLHWLAAEIEHGSDLLITRSLFGAKGKIGPTDWRDFSHRTQSCHEHHVGGELICIQVRHRG